MVEKRLRTTSLIEQTKNVNVLPALSKKLSADGGGTWGRIAVNWTQTKNFDK